MPNPTIPPQTGRQMQETGFPVPTSDEWAMWNGGRKVDAIRAIRTRVVPCPSLRMAKGAFEPEQQAEIARDYARAEAAAEVVKLAKVWWESTQAAPSLAAVDAALGQAVTRLNALTTP